MTDIGTVFGLLLSNQPAYMDLLTLSSGTVYLSNEAVNAAYNYTSLEIDLMARIVRATTSFKADKLTLNLSDLTDSEHGSKYDDLRKAFKGLLSKPMELYNRETKSYFGSNIIGSYNIKKNSGVVEIRMIPEITDLIVGAKVEYTSFQLESLLHLKGKYSKRLYILASQYLRTGVRYIEVADLRKQLQIPKDMYIQYADLRKRVLVPAFAEINEHSEMQINFEESKLGRAVNRIIIYSKLKEKVVEVQGDIKQTTRLLSYGLPQWLVTNILHTLPGEEINLILYRIDVKIANKEVSNPGPYARNTFKNLGVPVDRAIHVQSKLFA